ncbi:MAG: SGNH/GDSL hydrolase family protein [Planctomycetota bacterium]|jgi:lysophospholipase L1-like esterase
MRKRTVRVALSALLTTCALWTGRAAGAREPEWVDAMRKVHKGFKGNSGYVAQLGDSITYSMAFWSVFGWSDPDKYIPDDGLPKKPGKRWRDVIKGVRDKGGKNGNYSGWRIGNLQKAVDGVLSAKRPEVAIIMIGTNDVRGNRAPPGYEKGLEALIAKLIAAKCVPIISTIPPMRNKDAGVKEANGIIRKLAAKHKLPLVDYYEEIIKRRPDDWDGTLISKDGVHPSGGKNQVFTEENLKASGYALRNYVTFMKFREVYFKVLNPVRR